MSVSSSNRPPNRPPSRRRRHVRLPSLGGPDYTPIAISDTDEPSEGLADTRYGLVLPARRRTSLELIESKGGVFPNRSRDTRENVGFNAARTFAGLDDFPLPTKRCTNQDQDWSWDD